MTKKETYSHSKISTFEQCPQKYKYKYIDKIKINLKSIEGFLGSKVHEVLEWLYQEVKKGKIPSLDETIMIYISKWEKEFNPDIYYIVKKDQTQKDYFEKGIKFLLDYYQKNYPFDENTIALEKFVSITLDKYEEYRMIGIIDRLAYNKETDNYEIHDYKTANSLPTVEKIESDSQLPLYSIAVKNDFNTDKIQLVWHYLAHNKKIYSKRTNHQLMELKKQTVEQIKKIENTKFFPYNQSALCEWCEYRFLCSSNKQQNLNI